MTPDEFIAAWDWPRVLLPESASRPALPEDTIEFLQKAGLPRGLKFGHQPPFCLSFAHLVVGLPPLDQMTDRFCTGELTPAITADLYVIGDGWLDGGADQWWCIHAPTGRIDLFDIESDEMVRPVNSSVACLSESLVALRHAGSRIRRGDDWSATFRELRDSLERADPSFADEGEWVDCADWLESMESSRDELLFEPMHMDGPRITVID